MAKESPSITFAEAVIVGPGGAAIFSDNTLHYYDFIALRVLDSDVEDAFNNQFDASGAEETDPRFDATNIDIDLDPNYVVESLPAGTTVAVPFTLAFDDQRLRLNDRVLIRGELGMMPIINPTQMKAAKQAQHRFTSGLIRDYTAWLAKNAPGLRNRMKAGNAALVAGTSAYPDWLNAQHTAMQANGQWQRAFADFEATIAPQLAALNQTMTELAPPTQIINKYTIAEDTARSDGRMRWKQIPVPEGEFPLRELIPEHTYTAAQIRASDYAHRRYTDWLKDAQKK